MNEQITPFFNSIEIQEAELKLAKQSGVYAQDLEYFLAIEFLLSYKGSKDTVASYRRDEMLKALERYRIHLKLPPFPSIDDETPLIPKHKNRTTGITSTRQIRVIVQKCYDRTIESLLKDEKIEEANEMRQATVHWLRHTGISEDIKSGRPREHVRDDARHSSSVITDRYIDIPKADRHQSAKNKRILTMSAN